MLFFLFIFISFLSYIYYKYAQKANIIDNPNHRSSHSKPTVRGGGVVFLMAVLLYFLWQFKISYPYFFIGFLMLSVLGFIDDKKELSAKVRFPFQVIAVGFILYDAGLFTGNIPIYVQVISYIIAVGFINAFNFMDGINSITGFYTISILIPLLYLNTQYPIFDNNFFYIVLIAIVVFGFYNFRKKALMFAGDVGSMALAAALLFWLSKYMIALKSPLLLTFVAVYGVDSAITILYRLLHKENIFKAHRWHLYQKFVDKWHWSHMQVAFLYSIFQLVISILAILFINTSFKLQMIVLLLVYFFFITIYILLKKIK